MWSSTFLFLFFFLFTSPSQGFPSAGPSWNVSPGRPRGSLFVPPPHCGAPHEVSRHNPEKHMSDACFWHRFFLKVAHGIKVKRKWELWCCYNGPVWWYMVWSWMVDFADSIVRNMYEGAIGSRMSGEESQFAHPSFLMFSLWPWRKQPWRHPDDISSKSPDRHRHPLWVECGGRNL